MPTLFETVYFDWCYNFYTEQVAGIRYTQIYEVTLLQQ